MAHSTVADHSLEAPRWKTTAMRVLQWLTAFVFLAAGIAKLIGVQRVVDVFAQVGVGQWLRVATGVAEVLGALFVLVPRTAFLGGLLLAAIMTGAVLAHLFVIGGSPLPAIAMMLAALTIAWFHRP